MKVIVIVEYIHSGSWFPGLNFYMLSIMIARPYRFHGHNSLSFVYRKGRIARTSQCALKYVPNPRRSSYRAAVVVSKKLSKSAVVRNRIRRRIYETARGLVQPNAPYDLLFTAFSIEMADMPQKELNKIIEQLLQIAQIGKTTGTQ